MPNSATRLYTHPIDTPEALNELCTELAKYELIAFDTEFIREKTYFPEIALIQVATDGHSWLIDPIKLSAQDLQPLFAIFTNPKILKVLHAAQGDQECLYMTYKITASPTLDTAVGAALLGHGENIGLQKLLKEFLHIDLDKGHARTDWTVRPLPPQLLKYAHHDVLHLVSTAEKMLKKLEAKDRKSWALELSQKWEKPAAHQFHGYDQAMKLGKAGKINERTLMALAELYNWRDRHAARINIPRRRFVDDDVLLDLAKVRPQSLEHLSSFRGLNKGILKNQGDELIALFKKVHDAPKESLPVITKPEIPTGKESKAIEVIQTFLKIFAEEHDLSAKHLIQSEDLLKLVRKSYATPSEMVQDGILTEATAKLIGQDLIDLIHGVSSLKLSKTPSGLIPQIVKARI